MTKETARTLLIQIFNTYSNIITVNYKDGVIKEAFEMAIEALRKTENSSEIPNKSTRSKMEQVPNCIDCTHYGDYEVCKGCDDDYNKFKSYYEPKDEPQTDTEIARVIVHKAIDNSELAEYAYPNLRQRLHDAVDEYEPQTERSSE